MGILIALPIWVIVLWLFTAPNSNKNNAKLFMALCVVSLIFILGFRSGSTGTRDTGIYLQAFESAKNSRSLDSFLDKIGFEYGKNALFSEIGFFSYMWVSSLVLPTAQWFLVLTSAIMIGLTAKFIWDNSEDYGLSWIIFICLGSMTFAMNGMRQAMAMSICLLAYTYAKNKKPIKFLLIVLIAILFHKSALLFLIVYFVVNMKHGFKSTSLLVIGTAMFFSLADRLVFMYGDVVGEYYEIESFDSGGIITLAIYVIAIVLTLIVNVSLNNDDKAPFHLLALSVLGCALYCSRYLSTQIYERISYYFLYFLMLLLPSVFKKISAKERTIIVRLFLVCAVALYAYRISKGSFANFKLFFQGELL